jgi:hypothetical protein
LLESGDAVEGDQIPQRLAERVLDRRWTIGHQEALYGPGPETVKGRLHLLMISVLLWLRDQHDGLPQGVGLLERCRRP